MTDSWKWFYYQDTIYETVVEVENVYVQHGTRVSRRKRYQDSDKTQKKPTQSLPCTVEMDGVNIIMTGVVQIEEEEIATYNEPPFVTHIRHK